MCAMAVGPTAVTGTIDWRDEQCYVPATQSACGLYFTTHTTRQITLLIVKMYIWKVDTLT